MTRSTLRILGLALVLAGGPAFAFEESKQSVTGGNPAVPAAKGQPKPPLNIDGTGVSIDPAPAPSGTDIRIPGLGKLGVWPKLDFGLELLYGGRGETGKVEDPAPGRMEAPDGVQIRGHIKHRW